MANRVYRIRLMHGRTSVEVVPERPADGTTVVRLCTQQTFCTAKRVRAYILFKHPSAVLPILVSQCSWYSLG